VRHSLFAGIGNDKGGSIYGKAVGALAIMLASLAATDRTQAACLVNNAPATPPLINQTVTCTGTTNNGAFGFGNNGDTGNTYNIITDSTVSGDNLGITAVSVNVITNAGTISATADGPDVFGIFVEQGVVTLNNLSSGTISANGAAAIAMQTNDTVALQNAGTIQAKDATGIGIQAPYCHHHQQHGHHNRRFEGH
jgi:hypothetical protein